MKRVLITGASGFVGRHTVAPLIEHGYEVHGASRQNAVAGDRAGVTMHVADLLLPQAVDALVNAVRPTHLLHLAWTPDPGRAMASLENLRWAAATLNLFHAFAAAGGKRAVLVGSCAEYDWNFDFLSEVHTPLRPATLYGAAKNSVRELAEFAGRSSAISVAWARLFFLYGPYEQASRLVASVAGSLAAGRYVATSAGSQQRDYMHVEDAATGLVALLESELTGPINIASGDCVPVHAIVETLGRIAGRPDLLGIGELASRPGDPPRLAADLTRMREELRFAPHHSLEDGLAATYAWWRARV